MSPAATSAGTGSTNAHGALREWAQQYSVESEPLGRGSFASVYKGVNRETNEPVAVKVMTKARLGERALKMLSAEISILRTLEHPNVVCLRDSHTTERRILIVLEFCGGGDLGQFIQARGPSPEPTARHFMLQLAAGLTFLRSKRLIHRDIKPQNLLLSDSSPRASLKIADFGLARHLPQGSLAESMLGSPLYMAPEVLSNVAYDAKADLWSAGAVLYELMTAKHPYGGANQVELINNIRRNRPQLPPGVTLSPSCIELLGMLLVLRPEHRASLETFVSCPFLNPPVATAPPGGGGGDGSPSVSPRLSSAAKAPEPAGAAAARRHGQVSSSAQPPAATSGSAGGAAPPEREGDVAAAGSAGSGAHLSLHRAEQQQPQQWPAGGIARPTKTSSTAGQKEPILRHPGEGAVRTGAAPSSSAGRTTGGGSSAGAGAAAAAAAGPTTGGDGGGGTSSSSARKTETVRDPVGGRDGEWGWDWGGKGLTPALAATGTEGQSGVAHVIGITDEGPLPALPALPFGLGPFGLRGSFAEDGGARRGGGGGGGDGGGSEASAGFAFDLAFAGSPVHSRSRMVSAAAVPGGGGGEGGGGGDGERGCRSFSASDAVGPEGSRRRPVDATPGAVAAASASAAAAAECSVAVSAAKEGSASPASTRSARDHRSHSSPGQNSPGQQHRSRDQAASNTAAGVFSPPDPVYYTSRKHGEYASALGAGSAATGGSPGRWAGGGVSSSSSSRSSGGDASLSTGGGNQPSRHSSPSCSDESGQQQQRPLPGIAGSGSGSGSGNGSGGSSNSSANASNESPTAADLGVPVLLKPTFRGSDSLLTIPEDSTGFVLVTRPSSISCEHGQSCECWAWSAGGGGTAVGAGAIRSPSASYLAAANPYGGPGKAPAQVGGGGGGRGRGRRSGASAFLGLGNIWNTAVNTFRGVAGAHGRRGSWPAARGRQQQQQQHVSPPTAAASPVHLRGARSPREQHHLSPRSVSYRAVGSAAGSPSASGGGSRSGSSSSGSGSSRGGGSSITSRKDYQFQQQCGGGSGARVMVDHTNANTLSSGSAGSSASRQYQHQQQPPPQHLHRRNSEPVRPRAHSQPGPFEGGGGSVGGPRGCSSLVVHHPRNPEELVEAQRVKAAADRAEVVGKRTILVVTLADKTAQEAMALALESPVRADPPGADPVAAAAVAGGAGVSGLSVEEGGGVCARRRHDMLAEALSLYVKALAILQGALPGVLVECEGVARTEDFAAWNPLRAEHQGQQQPQRQQQQQQLQQKFGRPSPSTSPALLAERIALVTKASWLKELFSQTLQRAEHCRAQMSSPSVAASAKAAAAPTPAEFSSSSGQQRGGGGGDCPIRADGACSRDSRNQNSVDAAPSAAVAAAAVGGTGAGSPDAAAAAVYRSATEHGQEAAVCYLLGRSDAAVTHYIRACALLQLLALEPEMAGGGGAGEEGVLRPEQQQQQQQHGSCAGGGGGDDWRANLLAVADAYAQQVELISRGDGGNAGR